MLRTVKSALLWGMAACLLPLTAAAASGIVPDTYHIDHRSTVKLQVEPQWNEPAGLTDEGLVRHFLEVQGETYGLQDTTEELRLVRVRESLLGRHYHFQQELAGIDVDRGEIIVSVAKDDNRVYRVFNNFYPVMVAPEAGSALLSEDEAFDIAWRHLRAHGNLLASPSSRLLYVPEGEDFRLSYVVTLDLDAPYGGWKLRLDASTGEIVQLEDTRLMRLKTEETEIPLEDRISAYNGPTTDRREAFTRFTQQEQQQVQTYQKSITAMGSGIVFDPDPRATLLDSSLQDNSPPSSFTDAYFTRDLLDITYNGSTYSLTGPYINIVNWDPPNTPPSTTTDGDWTATRGNNAFNDAMTYFQIDQNQRYMQSLGFTGATGIQEGSIVTDTDGVNGADNSYYQPGSNRMSFGHGCVDDSEDTDVMLHEYGHAINHDINPGWGGGDMGAIGEGFGDYWAGSYSYITPNGMIFEPNWVFSWDGHGDGNQCWPGRILNAFGAIYNHNTFYGAHQSIPGGYQSDELWSTPNFQSLIQIMDLGYSRDEVDQIILEAQFGLGSGLKMRDMANAIIATAGLLQPGLPHAEIFIENFLRHAIIELPAAVLELDSVSITAGSNGSPDPGESVDLIVRIANTGTQEATDITATLSSSTGLVTVPVDASAYPDLPIGAQGDNLTDYVFTLDPDFQCGDNVDFELVVDFYHGGSNPDMTTMNFSLGTGVPVGVSEADSPELSIPDNYPTGVQTTIEISGTGAVVNEDLNMDINLEHPFIGNLMVRLQSPAGTTIWLHNRTGGANDDIIGNYPNSLTPMMPLTNFLGQPLDGTWTLIVSDHVQQNTGVLHSWGLNQRTGWDCDETTVAVEDDLQSLGFAVFQNQPNPFNPATVIRFQVPRDGSFTLDVFDITGRKVRTLHQGGLAGGVHEVTWRGRDDQGRPVSSGVYFYRLEGEGFSDTHKMVLLQ